MFTVVHQLSPKAESISEFKEALKEMTALFEGKEGFIAHQYLTPHKADDPYFTVTMWKDQKAYDAWEKNFANDLHSDAKFQKLNDLYAKKPFAGFYDADLLHS